jgi:hypothetical protein
LTRREARLKSIVVGGAPMNSESVTGVREGEILAGKYRVDKVLGSGGMGVVVSAHHLQLDERVAIKFLLPGAVGEPEALARFAREARAAVKIKSEHVARVSDVGTLASGAPYMVMEYLDGVDLAEHLVRRGRLAYEQAVDFVLQAAEAIAEAHVLGIVHRDLKPANLFLIRRPDGSPSIKVLDFGISKLTAGAAPGSGHGPSITKTSSMMGSPLYMSPEQLQSSKDVDARSDIWALGVILYELIAGRAPFSGENVPELCTKILSAAPAPLGAICPGLPALLEQVLGRALEKERARRFGSVAEFAGALYPLASAGARLSIARISGVQRASGFHGRVARTATLAGDAALPANTQGAFGRTNAAPPPRRAGVVLLGAGALAAATASAWFAWPRLFHDETTAPSTRGGSAAAAESTVPARASAAVASAGTARAAPLSAAASTSSASLPAPSVPARRTERAPRSSPAPRPEPSTLAAASTALPTLPAPPEVEPDAPPAKPPLPRRSVFEDRK